MVFPVVGGNESKVYEISNSLRFNDDDSASLNVTQSAGNRDTWTFSAWIKRGNLGTNQVIIISGSGASDYFVLNFNSSDKISWHQYNGSNYDVLETSDAVFRDPSAWYHIVLKVDTTDSTADNRVILYVNGSVASHTANTTFDQNEDTDFNNNGNTLDIGNDAQFNIGYAAFDGYMTEINFIDGTAKAQTDFGEFDDNGVWIPKKYTGTYGTNGFFLQFKQTGTSQNSSGIGADTSGNDNHFAVTNLAALDITEDTPTNNFATLNPLGYTSGGANYSEGNVKINTNDATRSAGVSTIGVSSGKWYWEIKHTSGASNSQVGISYDPQELARTTTSVGETSDSWSYVAADGDIRHDAADLHSGSAFSDGDIMNIALDLDNNYVYFGKNNTYQNSGNPTSGSSGTGGFALDAGETYFYIGGDRTTGGGATQEVNFGNPSFSISSGNTDGKYGNFEYAPPSGYYALCTKRLAEFG